VNTSNPITFPLINPNEPEALLAQLHVEDGQQVAQGDLLCTLETTKSTHELLSEFPGYVISLRYVQGDTVSAGDILCFIAGDPDWRPSETDIKETSIPTKAGDTSGAVPDGMRISNPALAIAHQHNLDLTQLPMDRLITKSMIRSLLSRGDQGDALTLPDEPFDPNSIIIFGGGGHGKALIDLLRSLSVYRIVGIVDDGISSTETIMGVPVLGGSEVLPGLYDRGVRLAVNAVGGIGSLAVRVKVFHLLAEAGFACPALVHPTAFVETSVNISPGVQVFPHAYVGSETSLGFGCIVNTGAIVSHDCSLGDYVNISPGAIIAGEVQIGAGTLIGMGATINLRVQIGQGARIGNGATVKQDLPENGLVQAGAIWPS